MRASLFLLVFSLVHWLIFTYLALRLVEGPMLWIVLGVPFFLIWLTPLVFWRSGDRHTRWWHHPLQIGSFLSMGFASFLLVLGLGRDLLLVLFSWLATPDWQLTLASPEAGHMVIWLSFLMTGLGAVVAMRGPRVKKVDIRLPNLPQGLHGLTIAQISDLHVGPTIGKRYVDRVVDMTKALSPDIVALTGDLIDGHVAQLRPKMERLAELGPRGRVFFVTGNHEYYWNGAAWVEEVTRLGATVLANESVVLEHKGDSVLIGGVIDPAAGRGQSGLGPDVSSAAKGEAPVKILLAHQPQAAEKAAEAGFHLQLSGHTHGGQFFPWTLVIHLFHRHVAGLSRQDNMHVYVSPGTGTWGPPVRLGTVPEITLLRLTPG